VPPTEELAMTTNDPRTAVAPRKGAGPGRVAAIVGSVFLLLIGGCLVLGGGVLMAVFGDDGQVASAKNPVTTPTAAVVTDVASIRDASDLADALGTPIVMFAADGGNASGLFVGIGRAAEVDAYLAGVEIDQAVDLEVDPYSLDLARRDGPETTADPPAQQDFWVESGTGATGIDLSWPVQDGDYRAVLMNADGAAGVQSQLSVGVGIARMFGLSLSLLIGGAVLILAAIALLVATRPRRQPLPAYAYPPPAGNGPVTGLEPPTGQAPPAATVPPDGPAMPAEPVPPLAERVPPAREPRS
jgi:hypothetical protein